MYYIVSLYTLLLPYDILAHKLNPPDTALQC